MQDYAEKRNELPALIPDSNDLDSKEKIALRGMVLLDKKNNETQTEEKIENANIDTLTKKSWESVAKRISKYHHVKKTETKQQ